MMRLLYALVATVGAATSATADSDQDARAALRERGIVLQSGKRFIVVLPLAEKPNDLPASATLKGSTLYVGGSTKLTRIGTYSWDFNGKLDFERVGIDDPWQLLTADLERTGDVYQLKCAAKDVMKDRRTVTLARADEKTSAALLGKAALFEEPVQEAPVFLARTGTTYLYVDTPNHKTYRLFMGKRGAMKSLAIKEIVDDDEGLILVTVKGTLTVKKGDGSATFGSAKKPGPVEVQSTVKNRKLIFRELGVYKSTPAGHPCYEL